MSGLTSSLSILAVMLGVLSPMAVAEAQVQLNTDVIVRSAKRNPDGSAFVHLMRETIPQNVNLDTRQSAVVVRSVLAHAEEAVNVRGQGRFIAAPLPDEDIAAPTEQESDEPELRPNFFQQQVGQASDANVHDRASQSRKGHGNMSAGLALAIPLN